MRVFEFATESQRMGPTTAIFIPHQRVDTTPLVTLTHVCSHWRALLLNMPSMWTRTDCFNLNRLSTFASRAGTLPLSLYISPPKAVKHFTGKNPSVITLYADRISRIDAEYIGGADLTDAVTLLLGMTQAPCPSLRCLNLRISGGLKALPSGKAAMILNQPTSSLKALALSNTIVEYIPENDFPYLTHLYLSFREGNHRELSRRILSMLSRCPLLEFLHLDCIPASAANVAPDAPGAPIALDNLRGIVFTRCHSSLLHVLDRFRLPQAVYVRMEEAAISPPFPLQALPDAIVKEATTLEIVTCRQREVPTCSVCVHVRGVDSALYVQGRTDNLATANAWQRDHLRLILPILASQLTAFLISSPLPAEELAQMPRLHTLKLPLWHSSSDTLGPLREVSAALGDGGLCDALRELWLRPHVLYIGEHRPESQDFPAVVDQYAATLGGMAAARARRGCALERLVVAPVWRTFNAGFLQPDDKRRSKETIEREVRGHVGALDVFVQTYEEYYRASEGVAVETAVWDVEREEAYWELPAEQQPVTAA